MRQSWDSLGEEKVVCSSQLEVGGTGGVWVKQGSVCVKTSCWLTVGLVALLVADEEGLVLGSVALAHLFANETRVLYQESAWFAG